MSRLGYAYQKENEGTVRVLGRDIRISPKRTYEVAKAIKNMEVKKAKTYLQKVVSLELPVKYKRYNREIPHQKGIGPGRYPVKSSQFMLKLLEELEANAESRGMSAEGLKIVHIAVHRAAVVQGRYKGGPHNTTTSHVEIIAKEKGE